MDTFAHGLAAYVIGRSAGSSVGWKWLMFFGALPDLIWLPFTLAHLLSSGSMVFFWGPYNVSHSLVVWAGVSAAAMFWRRNAFAYTWPFALHILIDIPGHTDMATPILWPVSDWHITGWFDWLSWPLMGATYAALLSALGLIMFRRKKKLTTSVVSPNS